MAGRVYICTSGWQYKHWRNTFYPEEIKIKDHFRYFQTPFDTVEINASFYRIPTKETFGNWRDKVNDNFIYAVKASRYITHFHKLLDTGDVLDKFLAHATELKEKLGVILFQLPPGWAIDTERFESFLKQLPDNIRYTFEFRNKSWYDDKIYSLLEEYNCAFCIYQLAGHLSPLKVTADFVYARLHGPKGKYKGNYDDEMLTEWATRCKEWANAGLDVYVYFDNDEKGYAPLNALRLKTLLKK